MPSGVELHSAVYGSDGPPLVVLHGLFGMGDNWATLARHWSSQYTVHTLDLRNHGQSPWDSEHSYAAMAEDLRLYLDRHHLTQVHLLGHSMGGKVAQWFACTYPERTASLICVDMAPRAYPPHHQEIFDALLAVDFSIASSRSDMERQLLPYVPHPGMRQFLLKNVGRPTPTTLGWKFNLPVLLHHYAEITRALPEEFVYNGPTLFVRGGLSGYIGENDLPELQHHFPNAQLKTVPNAGHWVHAEKPEELSEYLIHFWDSAV